jgi:hypothetical protein
MEKPMKAVLEFNYPLDTDKCRRAIHADEAFEALQEIKRSVDRKFTHKSDLEEVLRHVYRLADHVLRKTGEEV